MALKRVAVTLAALALALLVAGCFAAQLSQQKTLNYSYAGDPVRHFQVDSCITSMKAIGITQYYLLAFPASTTMQAPNESQTVLANSTRSQIYDFISQNPGVSFRALCAGLCIPVGLAEYHLGVLIRSGLVSFAHDGRYKRFFVSKRFNKREMIAICLLRHKRAKQILEALLRKRQLSHGKLANEVCITSQALTWQMKTLGNTEFVLQVNEGLRTIYNIDSASEPQLRTYLAIVG